jgi:hypothetical protein
LVTLDLELPTLNFVAGIDDGSGIDYHEVKIQDQTGGNIDLTPYLPFLSGDVYSGLTLTSGKTYQFVVRAVDKAGNKSAEITSDGWTVDSDGPTAPGVITGGPAPVNFKQQTPSWTFADSTDGAGSGLVGYKIQIRKFSDNSVVLGFQDGSGNGLSGLSLNLGREFLVSGETYYANIKAFDLAGNDSLEVQTPSWIALNCPANFIPVPARAGYTSLGFCVAKYEMKILGEADGKKDYDSSFIAESRATGTPWVRIKRDQAITECQDLGLGFDLINNDQWQAIAQNLELQNGNWTGLGGVGDGMMYRGHSDDSPDRPLSVIGIDPYDQTGNTAAQAAGSGKEQRRTHTLSNGETIWDFAGNVTEWLKDDNNDNYGNNSYISQITDLTHLINVGGKTARTRFGPSGNYTSLGGPQYGGLGKGLLDFNAGAIFRGGSHQSTTYSGVFYVDLDDGPTYKTDHSGFRCTQTP